MHNSTKNVNKRNRQTKKVNKKIKYTSDLTKIDKRRILTAQTTSEEPRERKKTKSQVILRYLDNS